MKKQITFTKISEIKSLQEYKDAINSITTSLLGSSTNLSEREWKKHFAAFLAKVRETNERESTEQKQKKRE
jgi:hypothetical protein